MLKKTIAVLVCGLVALVLAAGCEGFGLGGEGGSGGDGCDDAVFSAGGAGGSGGQADPCMGSLGRFRADNFNFVTIVADDGKDPAGGWQEATTALAFAHNLDVVVTCKVHIGMPLRAEAWGPISHGTAAIYSANVANAAAGVLWPTDLPAGIFCSKLKGEMQKQFDGTYPKLGALMQ